MRAGVYARLPPMAVKLNGDTAATKPSMPLYRMEFLVTDASSLMGWYLNSSLAKKALNL